MVGDPYWGNVVFLSGFEGGTVVDESPLAQTVTLSGSTAGSSAQSKFGTQSLSHPASGGATVPDNAAFISGAQAFTVEGWFRWTSHSGSYDYLIGQYDEVTTADAAWYLYFRSSGTDVLAARVHTATGWSDICSYLWTPTLNTWYHICFECNGTTKYRMYVDGAMVASYDSTPPYTIQNSTAPLSLGSLTTAAAATNTSFNGYMDDVRVTAGIARYNSDAGLTVPSAAYERGPADSEEISGPVVLADSLVAAIVYEATISDTFDLAAALGKDALAVDGVVIGLADRIGYGYPLSDSITAADALRLSNGATTRETVALATALVPNLTFGLSVQDQTIMSELIGIGWPAGVADGVVVTSTHKAVQSLMVVEALSIARTVAAGVRYQRSLADTLSFTDVVRRFIGGGVIDTITVGDVSAESVFKGAVAADAMTLTDTPVANLVIRAVAADSIDIDLVTILRSVFNETVIDGVELSAAYLSPGGTTITTWAMNTRTAAVSEYTNYPFNSFAKLGNKHIAANSEGLFELIGDDDDGADIVAQIRSGFAQWAGTRYTMFKGAYLAARGEGEFVLKLITGDGHEYDYLAFVRDMRTTKVNVGKGLRARYFAFELSNINGHDFDLDTLEFIPLVPQRRV